MSAQIFSKRSRYSGKREASIKYPLHPWITEATKKPSVYYANPDRPKIFQAVHGALQNITESGQPPYLKTGDLVWLSFSVEFIIGLHLVRRHERCRVQPGMYKGSSGMRERGGGTSDTLRAEMCRVGAGLHR